MMVVCAFFVGLIAGFTIAYKYLSWAMRQELTAETLARIDNDLKN